MVLGRKTIDLLPEPNAEWFHSGEIGITGGLRRMRGGVVDQMPTPVQAGVRWLMGDEEWPLRPVVSWCHASGKGTYRIPDGERVDTGLFGTWTEPFLRGSLAIDVDEVAVGGASTWRWREWRITAGGGPCWITAQATDEPSITLWRRFFPATIPPQREERVHRWGLWVGLSAEAQVSSAILGIEGRWTRVPVTLLGWEMEVGGPQVNGILAWGW